MPFRRDRFAVIELLHVFSKIGYNPTSKGITRLALTSEEQQARQALCSLLAELGIQPVIDAAGNVIGRLLGTDPSLPSIAIGSHLDTVPNGGRFDGALGVLAGVAVLAKIIAAGISPKRSIDLICFMGEESSRFGIGLIGSRIYNGKFSLEELRRIRDRNSVSIYEALQQNGFAIEEYENPRQHSCYIELHIEQGQVLEQEKLDIGLVTDIGSATRLKLFLQGNADHTATTPHSYRKDALLVAGKIIEAVREISLSFGDEYMQATVSNLIVHESAWNIVPHNVELHIDIRDYQVSRKALYRRQLVEHVQTCCEKNGISFAWQEVSDSQPRNIDAELIVQLEKVVQKLGYSYRHLVSGAGHDAQMMNCPIAMIFVPSKHGKSHSPEELTADEFLEKGCEVLHQLVLELLSNDTGL